MVARRLYIGHAAARRELSRQSRHTDELGKHQAEVANVALPLTPAGVRAIASKGFPLWESIEEMQLRNRRITTAYSDLSHQLADLLSSSDKSERPNANWCTFATWSSRTIGTCIDRDPEHGLIATATKPLPEPARRLVRTMSENLLTRGHGAIYRTLALGNRLVFLEIGTAVAEFVGTFSKSPSPKFEDYWDSMTGFLGDLTRLDPSWVTTPSPDQTVLREGMRSYHRAIAAADSKQRAESVLLGNLLLGAYEQTRVDEYLDTALAWNTEERLRGLVRGQPRSGVTALAWRLWLPASALNAVLSTRFFLVLEVPADGRLVELHVGRRVPPAADRRRFPELLTDISDPELQAVLTTYDLSDGRAEKTSAFDWARFSDRMNYITNLFRSRQLDEELFRDPWPSEYAAQLLRGDLPGGDDDPGLGRARRKT